MIKLAINSEVYGKKNKKPPDKQKSARIQGMPYVAVNARNNQLIAGGNLVNEQGFKSA